VICNTDWHSI